MIEGSDGKYHFQAGSICTPGFWRMSDKIGMPLDEIHVSGNVPQCKEKLEMSMERFFKRMPLDKPVIRDNYFMQIIKPTQPDNREARLDAEEATMSEVDPEELGWSESTNGREEDFVHGHGHSAKPASYLAASTLRLRSERQTPTNRWNRFWDTYVFVQGGGTCAGTRGGRTTGQRCSELAR